MTTTKYHLQITGELDHSQLYARNMMIIITRDGFISDSLSDSIGLYFTARIMTTVTAKKTKSDFVHTHTSQS